MRVPWRLAVVVLLMECTTGQHVCNKRCPSGYECRVVQNVEECYPSQSCDGMKCPPGEECRVDASTGKRTCMAVDPCAKQPCAPNEKCVPDRKQCTTTPCHQYRCEGNGTVDTPTPTNETYPPVTPPTDLCSSMQCGHGEECKVDRATGSPMCVKMMCNGMQCPPGEECRVDASTGKRTCMAVDPCAKQPCAPNEKCVPDWKQCTTTPCPQYRCEHPCRGKTCNAGQTCTLTRFGDAECGYNCYTREVWTDEKTKWCCEKQQLGCPHKELKEGDVCRSGGVTTGSPFDRSADCPKGTECMPVERWAIGGEAKYTCRKPDERYNCTVGTVWTPEQRKWCCDRRQVGCSLDTDPCATSPCKAGERCIPTPRMCISGACDQYKCEYLGERFNCTTKELWADDKRKWCCKVKQLGCSTPSEPLKPGERCRVAMVDRSTDCPKGTTCKEAKAANGVDEVWTCQEEVKDPCEWKKCVGKCVVSTAGTAECDDKPQNPCEAKQCKTGEICRAKAGKAVCEEELIDPCRECTPYQRCTLNATGAVCTPYTMCELVRWRMRVEPCLPPTECVMEGREAVCVERKETKCSHEKCKAEGKVCGKGGECVEDKCKDFVWPPADAEYCSKHSECKKEGYSCSGCTSTCRCDPTTGAKVCAKDCRRTCKKDEFECDLAKKESWSRREDLFCCVHKRVGCGEYDCTGRTPMSEWSSEQKQWCCKEMKRCVEVGEKYTCKEDPTRWDAEQREWCCKNKQTGCAPAVKCDGGADMPLRQRQYCCATQQVGCQCDAGVAPLTSAEREWCCKVKGVHCPEKDRYDCTTNTADFTKEQRKWCCVKKRVGCPVTCNVAEERRANWTTTERKFCCVYEGIGCTGSKDGGECLSGEMGSWEEKKRERCCREENIGCEVDCSVAPELLDSAGKDFCCQVKGVCLGTAPTNETTVGKGKKWVQLRLKVRGVWEKILANRKRYVRKLRLSLIKASALLQENPKRLILTYVGVLVNGTKVPTEDQREHFGFPVPPEWNTNDESIPSAVLQPPVDLETLWNTGSSRAMQLLAETEEELASASDNTFFESLIADESSEKVETITTSLNTAADSARNGKGPFMDNSEDHTLLLAPVGDDPVKMVAEGKQETEPSSSESSEGVQGWVWALISALGVACVAGVAVGVTLMRKRQKPKPVSFANISSDLEDLSCYKAHDSAQPGSELVRF